MAIAHMGQPLVVTDISFREIAEHPSCSLLQHRAWQREKVLRELAYLMQLEDLSTIDRVLSENTLIQNKFFLDPSVWQDPSTSVRLILETNQDFTAEVAKSGLDKTFLSIKAPGLQWTSPIGQLPDDITLSYDGLENKIVLEYPIYINDFCQKANQPIEVTWLSAQQEFSTKWTTSDVVEEIRLLLFDL